MCPPPVPPSVLPRPHIPDDQISSRCASPCANAVGEDHYSEGLVSSSQLIFLDPPWTWENKPRWHIPVLARGWHSSQKHGFLRLMPGSRAPCRSRVQLEWRKLKIIKEKKREERKRKRHHDKEKRIPAKAIALFCWNSGCRARREFGPLRDSAMVQFCKRVQTRRSTRP